MSQDLRLYQRAWRVTVDTIQISDLDVSFRVEKTLKPEPNTAELSIYNLNPTHRNQLQSLGQVPTKIEAGYGSTLSVLFLGYLRTSTTTKEGNDIITTLASGDGEKEIRTARVSTTVQKKTKVEDVIKQLVQALGVDKGNVDSAVKLIKTKINNDMFSEGSVLRGNVARELTNICRACGFLWSVQDGKFFMLPLKQATQDEAFELSSEHGLIGSPTIDNQGILTFKCLLIPDLFPGRLIKMNSAQVKGNYRLESASYTGDSSDQDWYVNGEAKAY